MRAIVTGARGFVGRGLIPWLASHGHAGIATGREAPKDLPAGWEGRARDDLLAAAAPLHADALIHLEVDQRGPGTTAADEEALEARNATATTAWLDWAGRQGIGRVVFTSSVMVMGPSHRPQLEDAAPAPAAPYGRSKVLAETMVREWAAAATGRTAVILRPSPVYGPGPESNLRNLVRQVVAGRPVIVGRGDARKSIVSRTNLTAAIEWAAMLDQSSFPPSGCDVFNVSDPTTLTFKELASLIAALAAAPTPRSIPTVFARLAAPVGDLVAAITHRDAPLTTPRLQAMLEPSDFPCTKLIAAGFRHPQSTREGLAELIASLALRHTSP